MGKESKRANLSGRVVRPSRLADDKWFLLLLVLLALVPRLDFLLANNFVVDADEAIVGLMAKHILEGQPIPAFYYGQHYMGSFEAICVAGLFAIFGVSSWGLKIAPLLFSLLFVVLVYQLGLALKDKLLARCMGLVVALPPQMLIIWSSMARGGYAELLCIGTLALTLTVRWLRAEKFSCHLLVCVAALLGFGFWVNNQIIYFALPIGIWVTVTLATDWRLGRNGRVRRLTLCGAISILAFLLGGLPFWLYNLQHGFVSFGIAKGASLADVWSQLWGFATIALPILVGASRQWQQTPVFSGALALGYSILVFAFLFALILRRAEVLNLFRLQLDRHFPAELMLALFISIVAIFCLSSFGALVESPRYLLPLYVPYAFLVGNLASELYARVRALAVVPLICVLGIHLSSAYLGGRALPGEPFVAKGERVAKDHQELMTWLGQKGIKLVRTNYWIGYRLAFETQEQVKFTQFREPYSVRIPQYENLVSSEDQEFIPLVLVPSQSELVRRALTLQGILFSEIKLSGYDVLYDLRPVSGASRRYTGKLQILASHQQEQGQGALDSDARTRWGSGTAQEPGMYFSLALPAGVRLQGFLYDLGSFMHDEPRDLQITLTGANGAEQILLAGGDYEAVRFLRDRGTSMHFRFPEQEVRKLELKNLGSKQRFDWSIAELELLQ